MPELVVQSQLQKHFVVTTLRPTATMRLSYITTIVSSSYQECQIIPLKRINKKSIQTQDVSNNRSRENGRTWLWGKLEKIARFETLEKNSCVFQNGLAFLGQIGKTCLSEFPEIYEVMPFLFICSS
jgi:hypothetical protein